MSTNKPLTNPTEKGNPDGVNHTLAVFLFTWGFSSAFGSEFTAALSRVRSNPALGPGALFSVDLSCQVLFTAPSTTTLTKYSFVAVSAALFVAGSLTSSFAGTERVDSSKDKVVMAPPPVCDPRWYISIGGSVDPDLGSDFSNGLQETFVFDDDDDDTVDIDIVSRDWDDLYNDWWNVRAEVGYALTNHIELFGKFEYTRAESQIVTGSYGLHRSQQFSRSVRLGVRQPMG